MKTVKEIFSIRYNYPAYYISSNLDRHIDNIIIPDFLNQFYKSYKLTITNPDVITNFIWTKLEEYINKLMCDSIIDDVWNVNPGWLLYKSMNQQIHSYYYYIEIDNSSYAFPIILKHE